MKSIILILSFSTFCSFNSYSQQPDPSQKELEDAIKQAVIQNLLNSVIDNNNQQAPLSPATPAYIGDMLGTLYFTDGTNKSFKSIIRTHQGPYKNASGLDSQNEGLLVFYQDSYRTIAYGNLKTLRIIPERVWNNFVSGELEVTTKNGVSFTTPAMLSDIDVTIFDELTNGIVEQNFRFASDSRLLISTIEFY